MIKKVIPPLDFKNGGVKELPSLFTDDNHTILGFDVTSDYGHLNIDLHNVDVGLDLRNTIIVGDGIGTPDGFNNGIITNNLIVNNNVELPPRPGEMRNVINEVGDWCIQFYHGHEWVTIRTEPSFITTGNNVVKKSRWTGIKNFFRELISRWC